jgi:hypothetical protein
MKMREMDKNRGASCPPPKNPNRRGYWRMVPSLLVCLTAMLTLRCTMQILSQREETVSSQPVCRKYDLQILREPTFDDPWMTFAAVREDSVKETKQKTIDFTRKPSEALRTGLGLSTMALAVLTSVALGYSREWTLVFGAPTIAVGVSFICAERMAERGWSGQRVQRTSERRSQLTPCVVTVRADGKELGIVQTDATGRKFDISKCVDSLPTGRDVEFTLTVKEAPQVLKKVVVGEQVIAGLRGREEARRDSIKKAEEEAARVERLRQQQDSIQQEEAVRAEQERQQFEERRQQRDSAWWAASWPRRIERSRFQTGDDTTTIRETMREVAGRLYLTVDQFEARTYYVHTNLADLASSGKSYFMPTILCGRYDAIPVLFAYAQCKGHWLLMKKAVVLVGERRYEAVCADEKPTYDYERGSGGKFSETGVFATEDDLVWAIASAPKGDSVYVRLSGWSEDRDFTLDAASRQAWRDMVYYCYHYDFRDQGVEATRVFQK